MSEPGEGNVDVVDLLIKKVAEGLSEEEERQLARSPIDTSKELERLERAAAAVTLTGMRSRHVLPEGLRERLVANARRFAAPEQEDRGQGAPLAAAQSAERVDSQAPSSPLAVEAPRPTAHEAPAPADIVTPARAARETAVSSGPTLRRARRTAIVGWLAAAAAAVVAVFVWNRPQEAMKPPSPSLERAQLLARADSIRLKWKSPDPNTPKVSGDVVWNPATQRGAMRLVGLKANDAKTQQYQLWIFDANRDERYPVDGGVFDVPAGRAEVILPMRASLAVATVKMFAITLEKTGGVVVSKREHLVAIAQPT